MGDFIAIFVEGETEKEFYEELIQFYRKQSTNKLKSHKVYNIKGIGKFESKMSLKLKGEVLNRHAAKDVKVICCYDTDVFELAKKPPVDWQVVKKKVAELGIANFTQVKAKRMIEDWFLYDFEGVCKFLKLKNQKKVDGKDGNDKMQKLFKKGGRLYIKGSHTQKFIPSLEMKVIRNAVLDQLSDLEKAIGVKIQDQKKAKKK